MLTETLMVDSSGTSANVAIGIDALTYEATV